MQMYALISTGLAIFAMLFGAGNVVFPLDLGRDTGAEVVFAVLGLALTGVVVPVIGLVSAALFNGDYARFLRMAGRIPGFLIMFLCMLLVGPFGATPRCLVLAHSALRWHIPALDLMIFSVLAAAVVFVATIRKRLIVDLMGRIFGPIKLVLLFTIITVGFLSTAQSHPSDYTPLSAFLKGFGEGYLTLDLIGVIFFSGLIIASIKSHAGPNVSSRQLAVYGLQAGIIGGGLLGLVYTGFCLIASKYGAELAFVEQSQLLSAVASLVLGDQASILANITMAIACTTTAIALTAVFADYLKTLLNNKINYYTSLLITILATFVMTNLGFAGVAAFIEPAVMLCYPALIVLSIANFAHVIWGFKHVQLVTAGTFIVSIGFKAYEFLSACMI